MTFKLDIAWHIDSQIISSVLYKKLSTLLENLWKKELFEYIKYIKVTPWKVVIKTQKPIVNSELKLIYEDIHNIFFETLIGFGFLYKELKITFI